MNYISREVVQKVLKYEHLIPAIENSLLNFSDRENGGVTQPLRSLLEMPSMKGRLFTMPCFFERGKALAVKLVTRYYPEENPSHNGIVVLLNPDNGSVQSIMDAECITSMRTAAASAIALKHLAVDKHKGDKILCIIGSGALAHSHLEAFKHICSFSEIRVWSRTPENAQKFAETTGAIPHHTVEAAVSNADVIVTVTSAVTPVLFGDWVKPGAFVCAVGAPCSHMRELDDTLMNKSIIFVESYESAMAESGDIILSKAKIAGELGDVIGGKIKIDVEPEKTIMFKSLGIAVYDAVSAKLVYEKHNAL